MQCLPVTANFMSNAFDSSAREDAIFAVQLWHRDQTAGHDSNQAQEGDHVAGTNFTFGSSMLTIDPACISIRVQNLAR